MRSMTALLCVGLVCACTGDGVIDPSRESIVLSISSSEVMTSAGDTRSVTAMLKKGTSEAGLPAATLEWSSSAPSVATVSVSGTSATITAVDDGTAIITAANGSAQGTVTVTVRRALAHVVVSAASASLTPGATMQLTATGSDARDNPIDGLRGFTFSSSNPGSVIVSASGLATALFNPFITQGSTVTATLTRDGVTASGSVEIGVVAPPTPDYAGIMLAELVKPDPVPATGIGLLSLFTDGGRVSYSIVWSALSGPATAIHVHGPGNPTQLAGVLVDFVPGTQTTNYGLLTGSFTASDIRPQGGQPPISLDSLITLVRTGNAYADVHTAGYPDGEIRGPLGGPFR